MSTREAKTVVIGCEAPESSADSASIASSDSMTANRKVSAAMK